MMLGVHRAVGFDYAPAADGEDGAATADGLWGQCKRLQPSGPLCSLNTHSMDIPEVWPNAASEEDSHVGGAAVEEGIPKPGCSDEAETAVVSVDNPRKNGSAKGTGSVGLRRSRRLAKVEANAEGSPGAASSLQFSVPPRGAQKSEEAEFSRNLSVVICEGGNLEPEFVESLASCIPGSGQVDDQLPESGLTKDSVNVARRRFPQLARHAARGTECASTALPELLASSGTLKFDTFAALNNLGSDACKEHSVACEFVKSSACSNMAELPKSSPKRKFSAAEYPNFCSEDRLMDGVGSGSASQSQSFQFEDLTNQQTDRDSIVVLALPCSSPSHRARKSHKVRFSRSSSSGSCIVDSLRPQAPEPVLSLDKVRSYESLGSQELGHVEMLKCSSEVKATKKPIYASTRRSQRLGKGTFNGNKCDPSEPSAMPQLTGTLTTQKISNSVTCKEVSSGCEYMEVAKCLDKLEETSGSRDTQKNKEAECKEIFPRTKVKETLRLFQAICRKLLREEESKARKACHNNRVDVMALNLIKEKGKCLNVGVQNYGSVPGVEIGDEFHYRAELSIIGLHRNILAGISYAKHDGIYVASSIVSYEGRFDFMERSDVLLYPGSSGNTSYYYRIKNEKQHGDQKLEGGTLALKNSMDVKIPVRVVVGLKEPKVTNCRISKVNGIVTYIYDGLYVVEKCWSEMGSRGFSMFRFQLRRMPGQRQLAIKEIQYSERSKVYRGLCMEDVSQGKEKIPVVVVNIIDDEHPPPFRYTNNVIYPSWHSPTPPTGCDCTDGCSDSVNCACAVKNGGEIPFNYDGAIVEAKPLVYECGPSCKCPSSCHNRVSQHGMKYPLEVFKTKSMGWGVRSLTSIPSGSFICEYTGEMIEESEANRRTDDDYLFDIGQNYYDKSLWEGLSTCIPGLRKDTYGKVDEDECFTIDAANCGNIGRFINHSCTPNLYAQNVLYDHDDKRMPHIMLFAAENISPLEELTYHYNYTIDQVLDLDGNIKKKDCCCGSVECTGRLY